MSRGFFVAITLVPVLGANLIAGDAWADSMRCGKWVVNESSSVDELLKKCGEPQSREVREEPILVRSAAGGMVRTGTTIVETWIYQPSPGKLPMQVQVAGGKIIRLERAD